MQTIPPRRRFVWGPGAKALVVFYAIVIIPSLFAVLNRFVALPSNEALALLFFVLPIGISELLLLYWSALSLFRFDPRRPTAGATYSQYSSYIFRRGINPIVIVLLLVLVGVFALASNSTEGLVVLTSPFWSPLLAPLRRRGLRFTKEGIAFDSPLFEYFYQWSELTSMRVDFERRTVQLETSDKQTVQLKTLGLSDAALYRIQAEIPQQLSSKPRPSFDLNSARFAVLDRQGESFSAWKQRLEQMHAADYRTSALSEEELRALLVHSETPPLRRVGAAMVLLAMKKTDAAHVRAIASETPERAVRVALRQTAEGTIAEKQLAKAEAEGNIALRL